MQGKQRNLLQPKQHTKIVIHNRYLQKKVPLVRNHDKLTVKRNLQDHRQAQIQRCKQKVHIPLQLNKLQKLPKLVISVILAYQILKEESGSKHIRNHWT
jgi:hypothetical protein